MIDGEHPGQNIVEDRLRAALVKYGRHLTDCELRTINYGTVGEGGKPGRRYTQVVGTCTCGLEEVFK
jgi:hypothetical protein